MGMERGSNEWVRVRIQADFRLGHQKMGMERGGNGWVRVRIQADFRLGHQKMGRGGNG